MNKILLFMFILFFACSTSEKITLEKSKEIDFKYDYYVLENGNIQFDVDYFLPYDKLIFKKNKNGFQSSVTISFSVIEIDKTILYNKSWLENIECDFFDETKSNIDYIGNFSFELENKENIEMHIIVNDFVNHKSYQKQKLIEANENYNLKDLKFYTKIENKYLNIDYVNESKLNNLDTLWIKYQIISENIGVDSLFFEIKSLSLNEEKNNKFAIPPSLLKKYEIKYFPVDISEFNKNDIIVNCLYGYDKKSRRINFKKNIKQVIDYSKLIYPMENYIFNSQEYIEYVDLDSFGRIEFIEDYWKQKKDNDLLYEFYNRVVYANTNFKKIGKPGSASDMGKIYIIYGKPLSVDFEFNENGEFEIWKYRNKKFIFINRFGYFECYRC